MKIDLSGTAAHCHRLDRRNRTHPPYELLSDQDLAFKRALSVPVLNVKAAGRHVLKCVTLICQGDEFIHDFYPVVSCRQERRSSHRLAESPPIGAPLTSVRSSD